MNKRETEPLTDSPGAETSLKEGHRDWASLPLPVVDELVRELKDTRRWRLDGRSLRLVNRHWSAAVTLYVEEIRPHPTRTIVDEDIASLPKFRRATSVDISPFLIRPSRYELPRNRKQKKLFLENWYEERLKRIVDVLCQLSDLKQIEVGLKTMIILHYYCARTREQFSRLDRISSVYFYECANLKLFGKTLWNTNWSWFRYDDQASDYSSTLTQLVCSLERLERLEVDGSVLDSCTQFGFLDQVKHVALNGIDSRILNQLSNPSATVPSVVNGYSRVRYILDISVEVTRLDGLNICLSGFMPEDLDKLCCTPESNDLKVLDLHGLDAFDIYAFPNETITTFRQLECLNIGYCRLVGKALRGNFPNLKALRIQECTLSDCDVRFVTQFHKLELLNWEGVCSPEGKSLHLPWEKLTLPKLQSLSVVPVLDDSELLFISQQTNLEVLHIGSCYDSICTRDIANEGILVLEELSNLRILYIEAWGTKARRVWSSLLSTNFVTKLEQLWVWFDPEYAENEDNLKRIKCISPHLILRYV